MALNEIENTAEQEDAGMLRMTFNVGECTNVNTKMRLATHLLLVPAIVGRYRGLFFCASMNSRQKVWDPSTHGTF